MTAIAVAGTAYQKNKIDRLLVVAPTSVCSVWPRELEDYADFPFEAVSLLGTKEKRLKALRKLDEMETTALKVAVINYESVWREDIFKAIRDWDPDMVIADESQRIKTYNSKQSMAMHEIGARARYKLALSGTPIQGNALDLFSQYKFLDRKVFGDNYFAFRNHYAVMGGFENRQVVGYKNMDELVKKEYDIAYRVTKEEALDLPEQTFRTIYIPMEGKERKNYETLVEAACVELANAGTVTVDNVLTKLLRLQQFTGGFLKADEGEEILSVFSGKLKALEDILDDYVLTTGKKMVVFCRFRTEIWAISSLLQKKKISFGCIYGDVKTEDRGKIVEDFQANPETKVFLAQIDTAGLGITLTAADTCVYYSVNYNYAAYSQSLARIHRIGQKNACTYLHLVVEDTVDEDVLNALNAKEDLARAVVDDWRRYFKKKTKKTAAAAEEG